MLQFRWSRMSKAHSFSWETRPPAVAPLGRSLDAGDVARPTGRAPEGVGHRPLSQHDGRERADRERSALDREAGRRAPARQDWSAALEAIAQAAHQHEARREELRELETRVHERLKRLESELLYAESRAQAAERRAVEAERRAAEAEEWLQRMYDRINEHFGIQR